MMEDEALLQVLKKGLLFRNMEDGEILEAIGTMQPRRRTYPGRTLVIRDGDALPQVGVVLSGRLHLFHIDANGNNNLMEDLEAGEPVGLARGRLAVYISTAGSPVGENDWGAGYMRAVPAEYIPPGAWEELIHLLTH